MFHKGFVSNEEIECACGCKTLIFKYDIRGRERTFAIGHINKGKSNTWRLKDQVKLRTARERAIKILRKAGITLCQVDNKLCSTKLEAHHIDKNPFNNDLSNLNMLCATHHRFADKRNMNLEQLKKLDIDYIISSGKRRYRR